MNVYHYLNMLFVHLGAQIKQQSTKPSSSPLKRKAASASTSARKLAKQRSRFAVGLFSLVIAGMFLSNLFACFILSRISSHNYPGGQAAVSLGVTKELLDAAKQSMDTVGLEDSRSDVATYVDNLAAQTGLSRFVQVNGVYYAKTPKIDDKTLVNTYKLIYLILEPKEVTTFLVEHCPLDQNRGVESNPESWRKTNNEIKCRIPNQPEMYCSMVDTLERFYSVNIGGLLRKIRQIDSPQAAIKVFDDKGFIKTRVALHIIRCSVRSKTNPFS
jgi:hypothetical protein